MNPDTQLILDELAKRFEELDAKWERRFRDVDSHMSQQLADSEHRAETRFSTLEQAAKVFDEWRPEIEGTVDDIRLELGKSRSIGIAQFGTKSSLNQGCSLPRLRLLLLP